MVVLYALGALVLGGAAYIRLAPSDPAVWHVGVAASGPADCAMQAASDSARLSCLIDGAPGDVLARLDTVAVATPRTTRLAGSAEEGRITWVTRTRLWGFPDYTTAEARGEGGQTRLDVFARQRFGNNDWGVNAARLAAWKAALGI